MKIYDIEKIDNETVFARLDLTREDKNLLGIKMRDSEWATLIVENGKVKDFVAYSEDERKEYDIAKILYEKGNEDFIDSFEYCSCDDLGDGVTRHWFETDMTQIPIRFEKLCSQVEHATKYGHKIGGVCICKYTRKDSDFIDYDSTICIYTDEELNEKEWYDITLETELTEEDIAILDSKTKGEE